MSDPDIVWFFTSENPRVSLILVNKSYYIWFIMYGTKTFLKLKDEVFELHLDERDKGRPSFI